MANQEFNCIRKRNLRRFRFSSETSSSFELPSMSDIFQINNLLKYLFHNILSNIFVIFHQINIKHGTEK